MPTKNGTTKKTHRYNFGRLRILIVLGVLIYVVAFMVNHQGDIATQVQRQAELLQTQSDLEQQVQYYSNELDYIGTDEYVEQEARNRFGWLKNGEVKYMEGRAGATDSQSDSAAESTSGAISAPASSAEPTYGDLPSQQPSAESSSGESPSATPSAEESAASSPSD